MADKGQGRLFGELLLELELVSRAQLQQALSLQRRSGQRIGEALLSLGYVSREQLKGALLESLGLSDARAGGPRLGELLVALKYLDRPQLEQALERQTRDGRKLGEILASLGHCSHKPIASRMLAA